MTWSYTVERRGSDAPSRALSVAVETERETSLPRRCGASARQGEVALLDQVGDRFRQLAKLRQIHLELLVVLVRLLELVHEAMQPLDASDDVVIQPPDRIHGLVRVRALPILDHHDRFGEKLELPRVLVQLLEKIREVILELSALDALEPVGFPLEQLGDAGAELPVILAAQRGLRIAAISRYVSCDILDDVDHCELRLPRAWHP